MKNRTPLLTLLSVCLMLWSCDDSTKKTEGCGNGLLDLGEACDGSELQGASCASLGYYNTLGTLTCGSQCQYDRTDCGGRCGDSMVDAENGEACDDMNLNGQTCQGLGYSGGTLSCGADCTFDMSGCTSACGNGIIEGGETCDDGNAFVGDGCSSACAVETGWECEGTPSDCTTICGDDLLAGDEDCDGDDLAGQTCETLGYYGGTLTCSTSCDFVITSCETYGRCGDDEIQLTSGEECEGSNLDAQSCTSLGYSPRGGALSCTAGCAFDETACVAKSGNADLATLTVSEGTLNPGFSPATTGYGIRLPNSVLSQTVLATAADAPYATVEVSPAQPMALVVGANPATVTVTAEDGTQKSYTVVIHRTNDVLSLNIGTLIYVPSGTFQRDSTATNLSVVSAFRMSQHEITRAQWTAVTGWADPSDTNYSSGVNDPVLMVSWYDAIAFCNKLSLLEGLMPVYSVSGIDFTNLTYAQIPTSDNATWNAATADWAANGYRLPTEMEWMWTAMGADTANPGATNTTGYAKVIAGNTVSNPIDDYAWYNANSGGKSHPVGLKLANELGFHDLSGNVWEYVWDWYGTYPAGTLTDYRGPASGLYRVLRGGGWIDMVYNLSVAARDIIYPYGRYFDIGLRVVRN